MGWIKVEVQIDTQKLAFEIESSGVYQLNCLYHVIKLQDNICDVFILKDMIILRTEDRDFRYGEANAPFVKAERHINNIDAYDWNGNHLWNIADIVGNIKMAFSGGSLATSASVQLHGNLPVADDYSFDLFFCIAGGYRFLIDPVHRRVLEKTCGKW